MPDPNETVIVCEYSIENPAFEEVWSKEVINCGGGNKNQKRSVERLYYVNKYIIQR